MPRAELLAGRSLQCIGVRRLVMAFDPDTDEPALLRSIVQLLRLSASAADARVDDAWAHTVEEKLNEALGTITKITDIHHSAGLVIRHAKTIERTASELESTLERLLSVARLALRSAASPVTVDGADMEVAA